MRTTELNQNWEMRMCGEDTLYKTSIPMSVYNTLLTHGRIEDPFYRDNELECLKLCDKDYELVSKFVVCGDELNMVDKMVLRFNGVDTLADVYMDDCHIGYLHNMHRTWELDVTDIVKEGVNDLRIVLHSPVRYIREEQKRVYTGGSHECMEGFPHLRKAHCMFGWDWGPRLPDAGIFRSVELLYIDKARIEQVYITQIHECKNDTQRRVKLDIEALVEYVKCGINKNRDALSSSLELIIEDDLMLEAELYAPNGECIAGPSRFNGRQLLFEIEKPELWWPNGYGSQPLYTVRIMLKQKADVDAKQITVLDVWERRIGLRTMTMNREITEWGENFAHEVNGVCIFAMGADYIPEDNLLSRVTKERTYKLLQSAANSNYNCIRVWGGGYYPDDYFYDICDELGLVVWQDFMFACASYELEDAFEADISQEIRDNVRRIRHHACLGLWCGNNEMETQTLDGCWKPSKKQIADYTKIFEYIIPKLVHEEDRNTFYWPSSPSSGGSFDNPWDENRGDMHYWDVWHGNKPFTDYRRYYFRYLSEFGFQSFPSLKTIETFTLPEDRNVFSRVMEMHQRNVAANGKIVNYLSATYRYPGDFNSFIYASQLLQAEAIRYGVEHFRRNRGRCMGTVVWQLNDIWPVASWASIDYFGRWKALQYAEKRMFAPILISCEEHGELDQRTFCIEEPHDIELSVRLNVTNETMSDISGTVRYELRDSYGNIVTNGSKVIMVPALSAVWCEKLCFDKADELEHYISYSFDVDGSIVSEGTSLFTAPKHFHFHNPELSFTVTEAASKEANGISEGDEICIKSACYAKNIEIMGVDGDLILSDNYFDMNPGEKHIRVLEGHAESIGLRSVFNIA